MTEPRFFVEESLVAGEQSLQESVFRHAVQVLRLQVGEPLRLFDGRGGEWQARLTQVNRREARVMVEAHQAIERESPLALTLAQAVSKGERMDFVLQKAVELGVSRIQPLLTDRCNLRLDAGRWERRQEHWQGVIVAACEQCGRNRVPQLEPLRSLAAWLPQATGGARLLLDPRADSGLPALAPGTPVTLLIGPEGGLAPQEIEQARAGGFVALRLGPRVLRTETAALAAITALQLRAGDLG